MGYETSAERWSPVQSVEKILLSVVSMLAGNYNHTCIIHVNSAYHNGEEFLLRGGNWLPLSEHQINYRQA